jgi:hypothetical protein
MAHEKSQRSDRYHVFHLDAKACIQAQTKCVSNGFGHVVTACLTQASLTNRLRARCSLSDPMKCKYTRREIGIVIHKLPAVMP